MTQNKIAAFGNPHAAGWDRAVAQTEANSVIKGPHNPYGSAAMTGEADPIDALPKKAREKFQAIQEQREDSRTLSLELSDRRNETRQRAGRRARPPKSMAWPTGGQSETLVWPESRQINRSI